MRVSGWLVRVDEMKEPYAMEWVDVAALIEAVRLSEAIKPSQQAKRDAFRKYGILGSRKDPPLTAIFYDIMLRLGLLDKAIAKLTGVSNPLLLDPYLRATLRVFIELKVFSKDRVVFKNLEKVKNKVSSYVSKHAHPYAGMWLWDIIDKLDNFNLTPENEEESLMFKYLLPPWYVRKVKELLNDEEAEKYFTSLLIKPKISVRVNTLKSTVDEVIKELEGKVRGLEVSDKVPNVIKFYGPYNFDRSPLHLNGKIVIQEEAAALAPYLLNPKPGEVVVDLAAAPGGKTELIGELMLNQGKIYAFDIDDMRIKRMRKLLERTGINIVNIYKRDGREAPKILGSEVADKVLVDAPCSSDGTLMKNPDLRWRLLESEVSKFSQLQYELILAGLKLLKPGGYLLYCTCSVLKEQDEDVILKVLKKRKDVELISLKGPYESGYIEGTMRAWPHKHNTIGFFYALLRKR